MTSTFATAKPRSPISVHSRRSSNSKCSNVTENFPIRWRTRSYSKKKQHTREGSPELKSAVSGFRENLSRNEEKRFPEAGKSQLLQSLYMDQQTGEMRLSTTDRAVGPDIYGEEDSYQIRRYFPNRRIRSRTQSDTTSPRAAKCVWDQSLKTRSMTMAFRNPSTSVESLPYLLQPIPTQQPVGNLLPRISRSAENIALTSSYEVPTRYPRGQQRPTGLASGHHALLLRHKEIVDASKKTRHSWHQRRKPDLYVTSDVRNVNSDERKERFDFNTKYLHKVYPTFLRVSDYPSNSPSHDVISTQHRCGQEVTSLMKANRKCLDWFNTWVDD